MKSLLLLSICLSVIYTLKAQDDGAILNGTYQKKTLPSLESNYNRKTIDDRQAIDYQYVGESQVMFSKAIWRIIDLRQKLNLPLYYPEKKMESEKRYSLIDLLMYGIQNQLIHAYKPNVDEFNEFKQETTFEEIRLAFGAKDETIEVEKSSGKYEKKKIEGTFNTFEVKEIMVKEEWIFDKQRSVLEVRIIGLCPIRHFYKDEDVEKKEALRRQMFWVYYPEIRPLLANHFVFNPKNEVKSTSFEDVFRFRRFSSYIFQEANTYNNRSIEEYTHQYLREGERIENDIYNYEMDFWEY